LKHGTKMFLGGVAIGAVVIGGVVLLNFNRLVPIVGREVNRVRDRNAPGGTLKTEEGQLSRVATVSTIPSDDAATGEGAILTERAGSVAVTKANPVASEATARPDWPSYNKVLTSERFSGLTEINNSNVQNLRVLCIYETGQHVSFQTGLLMVKGAIIGTTEKDIFAIDANTCREKWRTHEDYQSVSPLGVNRGAAYLDDRVFRGTQDGRVLAYNASTGRRLWSTQIAYTNLGETTPSAPVAWNGMVFIGNAGGDAKGVKGRMYGLDAATGRIVWEYYMVPKVPGDPVRGPQGANPPDSGSWKVADGQPISGGALWTSYTLDPKSGLLYVPGGNPAPDYVSHLREGENRYADSVVVLDAKTGAYVKHFPIVPRDWHDWDVSAPPVLIHTRGGRDLMSLAPKDGHLYGFDLSDNRLLYRVPVTTMENVDVQFSTMKPTHFCPGATGGAEWNGPAYDPQTNLVAIGEVDWCSSVQMQSDGTVERTPMGKPWFGMKFWNPYNSMGKADPPFTQWSGWVYGVDADSGEWKWRVHTNYPIVSGMTPTAGGVIFFGDVGGNFYAIDSLTGNRLFAKKLEGAIGGGVITYAAKDSQKVAVATGFESILWPTEQSTAKVVVLGL
jgi:alcohol dehydrogenase (cytochrome c)